MYVNTVMKKILKKSSGLDEYFSPKNPIEKNMIEP